MSAERQDDERHGFEKIADELRQQILDGTYPVGEPLPHTRDLLERFGVSATTLTRAMAILKEQQLVWRVGNRGMIVQEHRPVAVDITPRDLIEGKDEEWQAACQRANVVGTILSNNRRFSWAPAIPDIAQALNIGEYETVGFLLRAGMIRDVPVYVNQAFYPKALIESPPTAVVRQLISARLATDGESSLLKLPRGSWALSIERVSRDEAGRLVELVRIVANPLRVRLLEEDLPLSSAGTA